MLTALILFYLGKKARLTRLTPLPFYLSLPTILTLPVVETSKATIAFYVKSALDTKAWLKEVDQACSYNCNGFACIIMFLDVCSAERELGAEMCQLTICAANNVQY